jgi:hypothetical protein
LIGDPSLLYVLQATSCDTHKEPFFLYTVLLQQIGII